MPSHTNRFLALRLTVVTAWIFTQFPDYIKRPAPFRTVPNSKDTKNMSLSYDDFDALEAYGFVVHREKQSESNGPVTNSGV